MECLSDALETNGIKPQCKLNKIQVVESTLKRWGEITFRLP